MANILQFSDISFEAVIENLASLWAMEKIFVKFLNPFLNFLSM